MLLAACAVALVAWRAAQFTSGPVAVDSIPAHAFVDYAHERFDAPTSRRARSPRTVKHEAPLEEAGTSAALDSEAPVVRRLTSRETTEPNPTLSLAHAGAVPIEYGGVVYEARSLAKVISALSSLEWPEWTLLHSTRFEIDLERLEARLNGGEIDFESDILFIVAKRSDGSLFPESAQMQRGKKPDGSLCLIRSALLRSSCQGAVHGQRRDPETNVIRKMSGPRDLDAAMSIAVRGTRILVLEATPRLGGALAVEYPESDAT